MVTITKYVWDPVFDCVTHELDENNNVKAVYNNEPLPYGGVLSQRRGTTSHYWRSACKSDVAACLCAGIRLRFANKRRRNIASRMLIEAAKSGMFAGHHAGERLTLTNSSAINVR